MKKPQFESLDQMADATAAALAQAAAGSAFQLFRDKEFRRLAGLERLSQTEQDRIFNELVVASVVLIMLVLEAPDLRVAGEFRDYLADLNKRIPKAHVDHLRTLGVETKHLRDWKKLIAMPPLDPLFFYIFFYIRIYIFLYFDPISIYIFFFTLVLIRGKNQKFKFLREIDRA